jgi:S1-C subfamily serine protease
MSESSDLDFEKPRSPRAEEVGYDLSHALASVVSVRANIPDDAMTASVLGTERAGHGVVIGDQGLVLTIGYLITEAETVFLVDNENQTVPAHVVAYDQESGFGLLQALGKLNAPSIELGTTTDLHQGDRVVFAGTGASDSVLAQVILKREFAGYWEYLLDEALFTAPAHPNWGGCAVVGPDGRLCAIGSLLVQHVAADGESYNANMAVPIDLLKPIYDDLLMYGKTQKPARPWLGMMTTEYEGHLVVAGISSGGPAEDAGIEVGDVVLEVNGEAVSGLANMFRKIWALGDAGISVPLTIYRKDTTREVVVDSVNRNDRLKKPKVH